MLKTDTISSNKDSGKLAKLTVMYNKNSYKRTTCIERVGFSIIKKKFLICTYYVTINQYQPAINYYMTHYLGFYMLGYTVAQVKAAGA
jgi:hypothetical protein